jgi:Spy/CpxP family protein refolding chaperone
MNRLRWLTAAVAVVALLAGGLVYAQGPRPGRPGGPGGRGPLAGLGLPLRELQLTAAQKEQVQQIRSRHDAQMRDAMTRLETARRAQVKAVETVPADEAQITSLTQDMVQTEVDVAIQASRLNSEIWTVLTADQQVQVKKLREERQARVDQWRDNRQQRRK